jgi:hypothetical protein
MKGVARQLKKAIESAASPYGVDVEGPEKTGGNHFKWTLRLGKETRFFVTGSTPRCCEVLILRAQSKTRRTCKELKT